MQEIERTQEIMTDAYRRCEVDMFYTKHNERNVFAFKQRMDELALLWHRLYGGTVNEAKKRMEKGNKPKE